MRPALGALPISLSSERAVPLGSGGAGTEDKELIVALAGQLGTSLPSPPVEAGHQRVVRLELSHVDVPFLEKAGDAWNRNGACHDYV